MSQKILHWKKNNEAIFVYIIAFLKCDYGGWGSWTKHIYRHTAWPVEKGLLIWFQFLLWQFNVRAYYFVLSSMWQTIFKPGSTSATRAAPYHRICNFGGKINCSIFWYKVKVGLLSHFKLKITIELVQFPSVKFMARYWAGACCFWKLFHLEGWNMMLFLCLMAGNALLYKQTSEGPQFNII